MHWLMQFSEFVDFDVKDTQQFCDWPLAVIEGSLMDSMKVIRDIFGSKKMVLKQLSIKPAHVMKKTVV